MKSVSIAVLSLFFLFPVAQAVPKEGYKIAREYLKECKRNDVTPAIGNLGWIEVEKYWESVPKLKALRDKFEDADEALTGLLMNEEEYRSARQKYEEASSTSERKESLKEFNTVKHAVFRRLQSENHHYRRARKERDEALFESSIRTFEYMIEDYEKQGKELPVGWIRSDG